MKTHALLGYFRAKQKVQVEVQIAGAISTFACTVECSAAIVNCVHANDRSTTQGYVKHK